MKSSDTFEQKEISHSLASQKSGLCRFDGRHDEVAAEKTRRLIVSEVITGFSGFSRRC